MIHTLGNSQGSWITSAQELMGLTFPMPRDLVPGVIPEGSSILVAGPKKGKTLLALNISIAVASGGQALGGPKVAQGSVLYMALEDGKRRTQGRLSQMLNGAEVPKCLDFAWTCLPADHGGIDLIESWVHTAHNPVLVVVDTIKRIRPESKLGKTLYDSDYEAFAPLSDLAHKYHMSIMGIHHNRKMDSDDVLEEVSGSHGLTASCDSVLVLRRTRGQNNGVLWVIGRGGEDHQKALRLEYPNWILIDDTDGRRVSMERKEIIDLLSGGDKSLSPKDVSEQLGKPYDNIKQLMWKMANAGTLGVVDGKYTIQDIRSRVVSIHV